MNGVYFHIFRACRDIGQAFVLADLAQKDGSANCSSAANELRLTNEKILINEVNELNQIASNWRGLSSQVGPAFNRIQNAFPPVNSSGQYHSASAGFLLGMAIAGCSNAGKDSDLSKIQSKILLWLNDAKAHTKAIKDQGYKKDMADLDQEFSPSIASIFSIGRTTAAASQEFHRSVQLIQALSDKVANALR